MLVNQIKQIQNGFGWTQARMAKELGISRPLLSRIYTGQRNLQLKTIKGILARFPELKVNVIQTLEQ